MTKGLEVPAIAGLAVGVVFMAVFTMTIKGPLTQASIGTDADDDIPSENIFTGSSKIPDDFAIFYAAAGSKLDTKNNLYVKGMVCDPSIKIALRLDEIEMQRIWSSVQKNYFFSLPERLNDKCDDYLVPCGSMSPASNYNLTITANGDTHTVEYDSRDDLRHDGDFQRFSAIRGDIQSVLRQKDEIKELPSPRCGRL